MRVTLHFEKAACGKKKKKSTQKEKETKRKSLSVNTDPDLANKAQPRKKNMYCCLYRSMWLNGAHVGIRLAWQGMLPED